MTTTHAPHAVVVDGLTKRYGHRVAVDGLTFSVPSATVTGLIGPNGAGKTTLMAMVLGLVRPSSGQGSVLGHPITRPGEYLHRVGALIETPAFHPAVSGLDNLRSLAVLGGHPDAPVGELIELVGLAGRGGDRYGSYSLGMKQRLGIAAALLGDPELVILDEPTNGLDPAGMQDVRRIVGDIAVGGRTVIVSSHLLSELEQVCDWLVVIDHGGLVYCGTVDGLAGSPGRLVVRPQDPGRLGDLVAIAGSAGQPVEIGDGDLAVVLAGNGRGSSAGVDPARMAAEINHRAHVAGIMLTELHHDQPDLESRYLSLVHAAGAASPGRPKGADR